MFNIRKLNKKQGYSLVELSIVLVIIGLLIAAVVKGKSIIENARIKKVIGDIESVVSAYNTYYDLYSAYPGDDTDASGRWPTLVAAGDGDSYIEGGADCRTGPTDDTDECNEAWQALRAALMVKGDPTGSGESALPSHSFGGVIWIWHSDAGGTLGGDAAVDFGVIGDRNYIGISNLRGQIAEVIDNKFDDGAYDSGSVRGSGSYTADPEPIVSIYYAL